jgi:ATP-binding cassette subfamily F protein 3
VTRWQQPDAISLKYKCFQLFSFAEREDYKRIAGSSLYKYCWVTAPYLYFYFFSVCLFALGLKVKMVLGRCVVRQNFGYCQRRRGYVLKISVLLRVEKETKKRYMISVDGLSLEFGGTSLFKDISFAINEKDRIALMGKNGAGKSTLLKIIAGERQASKGRITAPADAVIAYLPQHLITENSRTLFEETSQAFASILEMEREIERLNQELGSRTDFESESYYKLIEDVSTLSEKYYSIEDTNIDSQIEKILLGLGFKRDDFNKPTSQFSGGWRMRIELAKILLQKPDLILLDEPTNHLDIESVQWLEEFLVNSAKAVIVISHDRAFVDNITSRTIELTMGRIWDYKVNYSKYLELRKERREQQQKQFDDQKKMIADNQDFIDRFKGTYSKTNQVQSRVRMLEKLEIIEVDEEDNSALKLRFPPSPRSGNYPLEIQDLSKNYDDYQVFNNVSLTLHRGDRVAFVGKNGEGKSTLIKTIMGEQGYTGQFSLGHNTLIGYFAQNEASLLNEEMSVFDTIDEVAKGEIRTKIKDFLGAFMFGGDSWDKKVKVLSGGERTRLAMIKLLLEPVNFLILDEPTNHLDLRTKDILKTALMNFDGTLVLVSHDRDFLDGMVHKVYEFGDKKVKEHIGDVKSFLEKKRMDSLREIEKK